MKCLNYFTKYIRAVVPVVFVVRLLPPNADGVVPTVVPEFKPDENKPDVVDGCLRLSL